MGGPEADAARDADRLLTNKTILVQVCYRPIICFGVIPGELSPYSSISAGLIAEKGFRPSSNVGS